jgi:hypothetical protein
VQSYIGEGAYPTRLSDIADGASPQQEPKLPTMKSANAYRSSPESGVTPFVTASAQEIQLAEELRRLIEQRYLVDSEPSDPYWCVGAD